MCFSGPDNWKVSGSQKQLELYLKTKSIFCVSSDFVSPSILHSGLLLTANLFVGLMYTGNTTADRPEGHISPSSRSTKTELEFQCHSRFLRKDYDWPSWG